MRDLSFLTPESVDSVLRVILLTILCLNAPLHAAGTGKLVAHLSHAGQPLTGANLRCLDPLMGAASDLEGRVILLGVPPGVRRFQISHVGLSTQWVDLLIISGQTSRLEVELVAEDIQAREIVVRADPHALPLNRTSQVSRLDGEGMQDLPMRDLGSLLSLESGLTRDDQGELHLRGGRSGELKFLIDGVEVQDPWSGRFAGIVNEDEVQELVLVAGTFNAEYGDAMSGVVNIVTRHGAREPGLRLRLESPGLLASPWRQRNAFPAVQDARPWSERDLDDWTTLQHRDLLFTTPGRIQLGLSLPLTQQWESRLALMSAAEDSHLPHGYQRQGDLMLGLGRPWGNGGRLDLGYERSRSEQLPYSHVWKYLPEHQATERAGQDRVQAVLARAWTPRLFSTLRLAWQRHQSWLGVLDRQGDPLALDLYLRPAYGEQQDFYLEGHSSLKEETRIHQLRLGADATLQVGAYHEWRAGMELRQDDLKARTLHNVWGEAERFDDRVAARPRQGALYLQDKLEYQHLVLNAGLRLDWRDVDATWVPDPSRPFTESEGVVRPAAATRVPTQSSLSPRLGLAFPFGDRAVLHAAYGHFLQFAPLQALYGNRELNLAYSAVPLVGNPRVRPQRTVAWEFGLNRDLDNGARLGITAWYKDLRDLLSTLEVIQYVQKLVVYHNTDFANARGMDFSLSRPLGKRGQFKLDYTWMNARGNAAEPKSGLIRASQLQEEAFNEFPLDYEQIHDLTATLDLRLPWDLQLDLVAQAGSGLPYTPVLDGDVQVPTNSANKPWILMSDAGLRWRHSLGSGELEVWLAASNLLDRRNTIHVYPFTGKPFDDPRQLIGSTPDALHDPSHVGAPRQIKLGVEISL